MYRHRERSKAISSFPRHQPPFHQRAKFRPEAVENIIKLVDTLAEKYINYKDKEWQSDNKYVEMVSKHNRNLTMMLISFMASIVVLMSILTFYNKVSGDALLFLGGTITGYIISFIQGLIFDLAPSRPTPEEN